jgi:glucose/arabinose dehydrogenase
MHKLLSPSLLIAASLLLGASGCTVSGGAQGESTQASAPPSGTTPDALIRAEVVRRYSGEAFREVVDAADLPSGALLLALKSGRLIEFDPIDGSTSLVADLEARVFSSGERGALAVALHPQFGIDDENRVFFSYIAEGSGVTRLESLRVDPLLMTERAGRTTILEFAHFNSNHNAADLEFDASGKLLMATGDSGGHGDPEKSSQDLASRLGKLLEIDIDATPSPVKVRGIGLRNPWKIALDQENQQLWIADVGQGEREEISVLSLSNMSERSEPVNFGWPIMEGDRCFGTETCSPPPGHLSPYATYTHDDGRCSIIGAALSGEHFVFGDYCTGEIMAIPLNGFAGGEPAVISWSGDVPNLRPGGIYADRSGRIWIFDQGSPTILSISLSR